MPKVTCDCGARLTAPETLSGKLVKCPQCAGPLRVPATEAEIDLLPEPAPAPAAPAVPAISAFSSRRPVQPLAPRVPAWKVYGRWALGLALL
ncbi:MAG TPA: hypothetical protein VMU54_23930, partial [Planctomycetota bacterium]|nr:hypothetical protein [Planctomycetota bacterium]